MIGAEGMPLVAAAPTDVAIGTERISLVAAEPAEVLAPEVRELGAEFGVVVELAAGVGLPQLISNPIDTSSTVIYVKTAVAVKDVESNATDETLRKYQDQHIRMSQCEFQL